MKIVNNTGSDTDNILNGSMVFEAELYHRGINPKISFFKDDKGNINLSLANWDTKEAIDSYTPDQAEEMLTALVEAVNFARHYDDGSSLFDNIQEDSNVKPKQSGGVEERTGV
jgi:hypothetical protein